MDFRDVVIEFIKTVPKGKVVSYGQVALACGKPTGAREVGRVLRIIDATSETIPWWRVVNAKGEISIKGNWTATKELQAQLLEREGVEIKNGFILNFALKRFTK